MTLERTAPAASSDLGAAAEAHPLDNVIWHALHGRQSRFAQGDDRARRYPADVALFAGLRDVTAASFASLSGLVPTGDQVALFTVTPVPPATQFKVVMAKAIHQMIATRVAAPTRPRDFERLDDSSVPDMLALVEVTRPGPFAARVKQLGDYLGVRADGQLIAMTGERMKIDGFTELTAVCVHPDHRGHGYAHDLVSAVAQAVLDRGEWPFLHVFSDNLPAIALYHRLGFTIRRTMQVTVLAGKP